MEGAAELAQRTARPGLGLGTIRVVDLLEEVILQPRPLAPQGSV